MKYYFWTEKMGVGYHGQPLIENIEFGLEQGEILTLIGPNGAGKSTILKSIARQLDVINGSIWIGEKKLEYFSGKELSRNMAVLLTERLHTEMMTCEDVVATGRYPYTGKFGILSKADEAIVRESMEQVHILEIGDRDVTKISDGQRQRVMLARAICQEPDIIILDEPTSFLDVKYKLEFLSILQEMKRKKKLTVIMSLHELDLAQRISDKILCIDGKYADRFGTPEEVFTPGYITELFHVTAGCFEEGNGSMELGTPEGEAEVFVIAGGGEGRKVYRRLQRQGIPFFTGIIYPNDLDYPVAKALAAQVIEAVSFEPPGQELIEYAKKKIESCKKVVCCRKAFGTYEQANQELLDYAGQCGKAGKIYGKSNYDTGNNVKRGKKPSGCRFVQNIQAGRLPGCTFQIAEYGIKFLYYRRRSGNGTGAGYAGGSGRNKTHGMHESDIAEAYKPYRFTGHCKWRGDWKYACQRVFCL